LKIKGSEYDEDYLSLIQSPKALSETSDGTRYVEPAEILGIKAEQAVSRFTEYEKESSLILTADDINYLWEFDRNTLSRNEFTIIKTLNSYLHSSRSNLHENGLEHEKTQEVLDKIYDFFKAEETRDVNSRSTSAAIRRTALLIYKSARIPGQQQLGGFF
jgi:hypothetical protein